MHSPVVMLAFPMLAMPARETANGGREELPTVASKVAPLKVSLQRMEPPKIYIPILYLLPRLRNAATSRQ
jgi:hypothetical protein